MLTAFLILVFHPFLTLACFSGFTLIVCPIAPVLFGPFLYRPPFRDPSFFGASAGLDFFVAGGGAVFRRFSSFSVVEFSSCFDFGLPFFIFRGGIEILRCSLTGHNFVSMSRCRFSLMFAVSFR